MDTHTVEGPTPQNRPTDHGASEPEITAVGTFAAGQSPQGSFLVAADADVGSFASGLEFHDEPAQS